MPAVANHQTVSADGEYTFEPQPVGREVLMEWDITAGTADITPGYLSLTGVFKPFLDASAGGGIVQGAAGGLVPVLVPNSGVVALKVESAAGGFSMKVCSVLIPR